MDVDRVSKILKSQAGYTSCPRSEPNASLHKSGVTVYTQQTADNGESKYSKAFAVTSKCY